MKKKYILILFASVIAIIVLIIVVQRPPRGEVTTQRGSIFFFEDGFVVEDKSRNPHEFYVMEIPPEFIKRVEIQDNGIKIFLRKGSMPFLDTDRQAQDAPFNIKTDIISVRVDRPRQDRVSICTKRDDSYTYSNEILDTNLIDTLIQARNWHASVATVLNKIER